ncbi:MAG: cytidylate kinase-like family protein [Clostridia bacterium]|nr:cytidylate kinase-like family protein [Clostridia bacterium]
MSNPLIITIGREFGSGGHEIGARVAKRLGIAFYDKELISLAAEKSGLSDEFIERHEQRSHGSFLAGLAASTTFTSGYFSPQNMPLSESIFISQAQVIRDLAEKESAVIVGRCADYILSGRENTINIFIFAPMEKRVQRVMEVYSLDEAEAMKKLSTSDKERGNHYFRYTDRKWGKAQNYDLCINSALLGLDKTADMIVDLAAIEARD